MDILLGNDVQLKWTFTTAADETQYNSGDIELTSATQSDVSVAVFTSEFSLSMYDPYRSRFWTATRPRDKKEILLNVRNAKTEDDGLYSLKLSYLKGSRPTSDKHGIRLNVLGKFQIFITFSGYSRLSFFIVHFVVLCCICFFLINLFLIISLDTA